MKTLPIGIQTFEKIIVKDCYYVDKTQFIKELAQTGGYYFLSRPRRFGKSLFLSTIKAAYQGRQELFKGLYLHDNWDFESIHPVVHISFGSGVVRSLQELQETFGEILYDHSHDYNLNYSKNSLKGQFAELIHLLCERYSRRVVVLVDEYDKPILDNIENSDLAIELREELKNYYSVVKDSDPYIEFVFITGVSKFSKVSLFSGLNNLKDITLDARLGALCGYTQKELERVFADRLEEVDLDLVREWYNGYNWLGEDVYNPFDILLYLDFKVFSNYWFETGSPSFLIKLLGSRRYHIPVLESLQASEKLLSSFDVDQLEIETLLFQTGYLTLRSVRELTGNRRFDLAYPNREVKQSLSDYLLGYLTNNLAYSENTKFSVYDALEANDLDKLGELFQAFFSSIPFDWYRKNQLAGYEGYYSSIVYCYFAALGLDVRPEEPSNKGKMDLVVHFQDRSYILEFKVLEQTDGENPLEQIKSRGYPEKFAGRELYLIGVLFSSEERNIVKFEWELLSS